MFCPPDSLVQPDLPLYSPLQEETVSAGFPSPAEPSGEYPLDLNALLVPHPVSTYFVRVSGDSMRDAGILNGDILVVDRALTLADGQIIVASLDGEFTVKTFRRHGNTLSLEPANPAYSPIFLHEGMQFELFGVVTASIHRWIKTGNRSCTR